MLIKIQAYYCCWNDLVDEMAKERAAKDWPPPEFEVQFFGNSRHHYEGCVVFREINRRKDEIKRQKEIEAQF